MTAAKYQLGSIDDLEYADKHVKFTIAPGTITTPDISYSDRTIFAAVRPSEEQIRNSYLPLDVFLFPCCWPSLILMLPALLIVAVSDPPILRESLLIVTDKEILWFCKNVGASYKNKSIMLADIDTIGVYTTGLMNMKKISYVRVTENGKSGSQDWLTSDPESIVKLVMDIRNKSTAIYSIDPPAYESEGSSVQTFQKTRIEP